MTANGVLQLVLYVVVLLALAKPLGAYMARVYEGRPFGLDRVLGPVERLIYRLSGVRPDEEMDWKNYAIAMLALQLAGLLAVYGLQRLQGVLPLNPAGARRRVAGFLVQHGGELRDEHQLAGLRRRDHHELPHPDARAHGPELRLGRRRHGNARCVHPRASCAARPRPSATSGWISPARLSTSCCPSPSCWRWLLVSQGVVQTFGAYAKVTVLQRPAMTSRSPSRTASRSSTRRASRRPRNRR